MNKKRYYINIFLIGFVGYFIGTIAYSLLGGDNRLGSYLSGLVAASSIALLYYLFLRKKHAKMLKEIELERKDERGQVISGKSSLYTLVLAGVLTLLIFVFSIAKGYEAISMMIGGAYVLTIVFNLMVDSYLSKHN